MEIKNIRTYIARCADKPWHEMGIWDKFVCVGVAVVFALFFIVGTAL